MKPTDHKKSSLSIVIILVFLSFLLPPGGEKAMGESEVGVGLESNLPLGGEESGSSYGVYARTGGLLSLELAGFVPAGKSPAKFVQVFSYLMLNVRLGLFDLFAGISPDIAVEPETPSFHISSSQGYGKAGLRLSVTPISVYLQTTALVTMEGSLQKTSTGVGIGLSF